MSISKKAPDGAKIFDLEATRTARAEARAGEPATYIKLPSGYVEIKSEFDMLVSEDLINGRLHSAMTRLFANADDADALLKEGISKEDLTAIIEFASDKKLGEFLASSEL